MNSQNNSNVRYMSTSYQVDSTEAVSRTHRQKKKNKFKYHRVAHKGEIKGKKIQKRKNKLSTH